MSDRTVSRRSVLRTTGAVALVGATGLASAAPLDVETTGWSDVKTDSAILHGKLYGLGGSGTAYVQFSYEAEPDGPRLFTNHEEVNDTGTFSHDIDNLYEGTTYSFYARAESEDGSSVNLGQTLQFTTDSSGGGGGGGCGPSCIDPE